MSKEIKEREIVRELARTVTAISAEPRMKAIRKRWCDVNALRKPDRAPVWCRPVGCWREIIPEESLLCSDSELRKMEYHFRQIIHKRELDDDTPVEGYFEVNAIIRRDPENTWGLDIGRHVSDAPGGAWGYDPPLKQAADFDRLRIPTFTVDDAATRRRLAQIAELLDGILPVKLCVGPLLGATLGTAAADLRGLEQMMLDMATEPALMHRLMAYLRDTVLSALDQVEAQNLLTADNVGAMTCSDPIGRPQPDGRLTARNLWCMANSQEFDQVSPVMWEEFCLNYQKPIFERFGLVGYGCCENLTHKINGVLSIPNLRIFTCSAWTDLKTVLERVGRNYCIMWRQKASEVVFPKESGTIRQDLLNGARQLQGCYYQIVLRELETLGGHPDRLHVWTRYAREAAEQFA
ncbi:MAG: hypothetical protein KKE37_05700 [Verrucomicrobia bacterium]|nr:hypothetical protein [Verrucomicrobiota bacterium]MBU4428831.1 hypothetical protein [Verrucomicrobiota bacterium]MCG2681461.1 hypothetical protein [Kiritimatiellia bacterium]